MKNEIRLFAVLISILVSAHSTLADWIRTNGPGGGHIEALATDGTIFYASVLGHGIFISSDDGITWSASNSGLTRLSVQSIAVKGSTIFAGTDSSGVFLSSDNGVNWVPANSGLNDLCIRSISIHDSAIFVGTNHGICVSTNNGVLWTADSLGISDKAVTAFAVKDTILFAGTATNGVYISTLNNNHWHQSGLSGAFIAGLVRNDSAVIAGGNTGVYKSSNNGSGWSQLATTKIWATYVPIVLSGQRLFGSCLMPGGSPIWSSTDNGDTWSALSIVGIGNINLRSLLVKDSIILAGGEGALFRSTDNGNNWACVEKGLPFARVSSVVAIGSTVYAGVMSTAYNNFSGGGISLSTDNGESWSPMNSGLDEFEITSMAKAGSYLFAGGSWYTFASSNNGTTWNKSSTEAVSKDVVQNGPDFFMVSSSTIYESTDNGIHWTNKSSGLPQYYNSQAQAWYRYSISSLASIDSTLFAGSVGDGVYISTDNGSHWSKTKSTHADSTINSLLVRNSTLYAGSAKGVLRSTDKGLKWDTIGLANKAINGFATKDQNMFAITTNGLFISSNDGTSWTEIDQGLEDKNVYTIAIGDEYIYTGTQGQSVWRRPLSEIIVGIQKEALHLPSRFILKQNYPNPFNPKTVISYQLSVNSRISLKVYDMLGRSVATLVNEEKPAGIYSVTFDASKLSSGIYFYRLEAGSYVETRKLVFIK